MKFTDLTAVEDMDGDEMTKVVGGISFGEWQSARVLAAGEGVANLPQVKANEALLGLRNFGKLVQYLSEKLDLSGGKGVRARANSVGGFDIDIPPGLPPGN